MANVRFGDSRAFMKMWADGFGTGLQVQNANANNYMKEFVKFR